MDATCRTGSCACGAHNPKQLLDSFSEGTRSAISKRVASDGRKLAELALHVHGPAALAHLSEALRDNGLKPPARWGTQEARDFVAALGFPPEFSVSPSQKRPAELAVSGPMPLGGLHDYQTEIIDELAHIIGSRGAKARTKVSLPTGAGKTRVAVEAAVKYVLAADGSSKYVLWVAQTDELCEQAVPSFPAKSGATVAKTGRNSGSFAYGEGTPIRRRLPMMCPRRW